MATNQERKLSKDVVKAIGAMPLWAWDPSYASLHRKALPEAIDEDDEEQSFRQFVDMGKREPNARGTGRWLVTRERNSIAIVCIGDVEEATVQGVKSYLSAFFYGRMQVELHSSFPNVHVQEDDKSISSKEKGTKKDKNAKPKDDSTLIMGSYAYSVQQANVDGELCFEVFSLFDMLAYAVDDDEKHSNPYYCVIALVNHGLCEQVDDEYLAVLGRACGDRVCVVDARHASATTKKGTHISKNSVSVTQTVAKRNLRTLLATTAHETLHCFGLDHCITWQCLMNSHQVDEHEFLFLSPLNLKKLVYAMLPPSDQTKQGNDTMLVNRYVIQRYNALGGVLKSLGFSKDATWAYRKASLVEEATKGSGGGRNVAPVSSRNNTRDHHGGGSRKKKQQRKMY
ncbi:unnamed protein product [Cylindrotheca closterium]|uniref:Uncharacterized protein n=1 Tax=Cylindrotheca closterium TaxID=2856 RepID=A0AAD2G446_9STRA|nr:unnamed protein product [Cylindrotheca closterium]